MNAAQLAALQAANRYRKAQAQKRREANVTCPYCTLIIRKHRADARCRHENGQYYHVACFNKHRENCNACTMMTGKAGR